MQIEDRRLFQDIASQNLPTCVAKLEPRGIQREDREDDYRHRMVANFIAFIVTMALIAGGVWLAANIDYHRSAGAR